MRRPLIALVLLTLACGSSYKDQAAKCAAPRTGTDPYTNTGYPDQKGSLNDEKGWLRGFMGDLYLWYKEIPSVDASKYSTITDYFQALKTPLKTASNKLKDQFSFTIATADWEALIQSGVSAGYGVIWVSASRVPPGKIYVGDSESTSPAATANLSRGAEVLLIDNAPMLDPNGVINPGLSPKAVGEKHTFTVLDRSGTQRTFDMTAAAVTSVPVKYVGLIPNTKVGYLLFNKHVATAEQGLFDAVNKLKGLGATDLMVDLRYNGGGYLYIASELAYMIAGPGPTTNVTFERTLFNDKYPTQDPVTGAPLATPFLTRSSGGQALPHLDLPRVFVLTAGGTCSASESVINGLLGAGVNVNLIGHNTCGKPYGFYGQDNCGTTFLAIEFQGVNAKGFGDYADGFVPGGGGPAGPPGCQVVDDFTHDLGDPAEGRLAAALQFRATQTCPAPTSRPESAIPEESETVLVGNPLLENRILGMPR
jgi:C-terminal processing protease CtpA/Prc